MSVNVTLDRYDHLIPELDEALARSFGAQMEATLAGLDQKTVVHARLEAR